MPRDTDRPTPPLRANSDHEMIPLIDIFAGPGGLSEGFSAFADKQRDSVFDVMLSIEMEANAYETLKLRTFFRHSTDGARLDYYKFLRQEITLNALYEAHPLVAREAQKRCWQARLGPDGQPGHLVRSRIDNALAGANNWVLIGGPPCQAYSLAGRSRNAGNPNYNPKKDVRQRLYVDYLQILADHRPVVFILENVKGLLSATLQSATLQNELIFHRILEDLRDPAAALAREGRESRGRSGEGYRIFSLVEHRMFENGDLEGSVIRAERYGIPQARHRVILLGVRDDVKGVPQVLTPQDEVPMSAVINQLPPLRSGLSRRYDSAKAWADCLRSQLGSRWVNAGTRKIDTDDLSKFLKDSLSATNPPPCDRGGEFVRAEVTCDYAREWYSDEKIGGICNHSTRGHIKKDLYRYFYAACYAKLHGKSPSLHQFPTDLLPDHANVATALEEGGNFSDRFRVQIAERPSTTIVSHISKDGHYYIHPDPAQCRSLTVREAARLQTFPDNYFFCGSRTAQYVQVGNAVPPLLAKQIAAVVYNFLRNNGGA